MTTKVITSNSNRKTNKIIKGASHRNVRFKANVVSTSMETEDKSALSSKKRNHMCMIYNEI